MASAVLPVRMRWRHGRVGPAVGQGVDVEGGWPRVGTSARVSCSRRAGAGEEMGWVSSSKASQQRRWSSSSSGCSGISTGGEGGQQRAMAMMASRIVGPGWKRDRRHR